MAWLVAAVLWSGYYPTEACRAFIYDAVVQVHWGHQLSLPEPQPVPRSCYYLLTPQERQLLRPWLSD